jgi:hypothetical protein
MIGVMLMYRSILRFFLILTCLFLLEQTGVVSDIFATKPVPSLSNQSQIIKLQKEIEKLQKELLTFTDEQQKAETLLTIQESAEQLEKLQKAEAVLQELKQKGFVKEGAQIEKVVEPKSISASEIIFIKDKNSCPVVAKLFKKVDDFVQEHKAITAGVAYAELVNQLRKNCSYNLPIIVGPQGGIVVEGVGVMLLEKAEGKSLADLIENIPSMPDDRIKDLFSKIGQQFGALDDVMLRNTEKILTHTDTHAGNYLYDEPNNQLYWIDTSGYKGLKLADEKDSLNGKYALMFNGPFADDTLSTRRFNYAYTYGTPPSNKEAVRDFYLALRKRMMASQAFSQGYYNQNKINLVKEGHNNSEEAAALKNTIAKLNEELKSYGLTLEPFAFERDYAIK